MIKQEGTSSAKQVFALLGSACLLMIIPVKLIRFADIVHANEFITGIAPSFLGTAGLLFLILSRTGKLSHLKLFQVTLITTLIALGSEFIQSVPRRGILANVHYTFDWFDILASIAGVITGYIIALSIIKKKGILL